MHQDRAPYEPDDTAGSNRETADGSAADRDALTAKGSPGEIASQTHKAPGTRRARLTGDQKADLKRRFPCPGVATQHGLDCALSPRLCGPCPIEGIDWEAAYAEQLKINDSHVARGRAFERENADLRGGILNLQRQLEDQRR